MSYKETRQMSSSGRIFLGVGLGLVAVALVMVALAVFSLGALLGTSGSDTVEVTQGSGSERVAVIELSGEILDSEEVIRQLKKYRDRTSIKAIVLRMDSPGGAVAPSQEIFDEVRRTRDMGTPVVASMSSVAASGAYYIAAAADVIVANPGTITGSIGVISQFLDFSGLMDRVGIGSTTITSGQYKAAGSPLREMTPAERAQLQSLIDDVYEQFIADVAEGRELPLDSVRVLADGRVYTGRQAVANGLVDTLGTMETAVRIAGNLGKVEGTPRVVRERPRETLMDLVMGNEAGERIRRAAVELSTRPVLEYHLSFGR